MTSPRPTEIIAKCSSSKAFKNWAEIGRGRLPTLPNGWAVPASPYSRSINFMPVSSEIELERVTFTHPA